MSDPTVEAIAQFAHDDGCGCWEGAPKGTPLPGLLNPEDVEDREDPEYFAQGYPGCTMEEPEYWEERGVAILAAVRPLIEHCPGSNHE